MVVLWANIFRKPPASVETANLDINFCSLLLRSSFFFTFIALDLFEKWYERSWYFLALASWRCAAVENVWNHKGNHKNNCIAEGNKYFLQFLGTTTVIELKPEALEKPKAVMNFLNTIEMKQLPRNSRVALEERANRVPQEFQNMTIDQGK